MKSAALALAIGWCSSKSSHDPGFPVPPPTASPQAFVIAADDAALSVVPLIDAPPQIVAAAHDEPEVWLKGSTHVHAKPSGDSKEPPDAVIKWYEDRGYDFIALTDHNRVTEVTTQHKLVVLPGIELTHNPNHCLPAGDASGKCRIHVNAIGVTARPGGKLEWAERRSHQRVDLYHAALIASRALGAAVVQINHPQWFWGMNADVLAEIARRGAALVEIENVQFDKWNRGDAHHPSMQQIWDGALAQGVTMWGVATDDAHDYGEVKGKYPAGGGWVVVKARRDPQAILDALANGRFYASTGVVLDRAEVAEGELVVEVAASESGQFTIEWIENGKLVATDRAKAARHAVPKTGYIRAVVNRDDGKQAWVQPARRPS